MRRLKVNTIFLVIITGLCSIISVGYSVLSQAVTVGGDASYSTKLLYSVFEKPSNSSYVQEYTGAHQDSMTGVGSEKIYYWYTSSTLSNSTSVVNILNGWNVIFGGFCWQMTRTTDTGGVKMIYNGIPNNGECNNTGTDQTIGSSIFNSDSLSPSSVGYMYKAMYTSSDKRMLNDTTQYVFGNSFTYSGGTYTLVNTITLTGTWSNDYNTLNNNHYTCFTTGNTCTELYYVYKTNKAVDGYDKADIHYITLTNGKSVLNAMMDMFYAIDVNTTNSIVKDFIDNWYALNLSSYTYQIEDTIYCNDREIINSGTNGWKPNGGDTSEHLRFKYPSDSDLSCPNETDKFSISNNYAKLIYPIGLPTAYEIKMIGSSRLAETGCQYWLGTPYGASYHIHTNRLDYANYAVTTTGSITSTINAIVSNQFYVRPMISLQPGTKYISGNGSTSSPYIVDAQAPPYVYSFNKHIANGAHISELGIFYINLEKATTVFSENVFLRHNIQNNIITSSSVTFIKDDTPHYLQGGGATYNSSIDDYNNDSIYYTANKQVLDTAFGSSNCAEYSNPTYYSCSADGVNADVYARGDVSANIGRWYCNVYADSSSYCGDMWV